MHSKNTGIITDIIYFFNIKKKLHTKKPTPHILIFGQNLEQHPLLTYERKYKQFEKIGIAKATKNIKGKKRLTEY